MRRAKTNVCVKTLWGDYKTPSREIQNVFNVSLFIWFCILNAIISNTTAKLEKE